MRQLRSLLNTPANRPEMIAKAPGYGADALILDLEDAVPAGQRPEARQIARHYLAELGRQGQVLYVRVNSVGSGMLEDDLDAIACEHLEGIQLPKVASPSDVRTADRLLAELERERGLTVGGIELFVSIESAAAVWWVHEILSAAPRVGSVMIGTAEHGDLQGDLGFVRTEEETELLYARSRVLLAARVVGIDNPVDGVYADHGDVEGLRRSALRARQLGYRGKKAIHPRQIEPINQVFSPTPAELDRYARIVAAFEDALADGRATAVVDGKMIDHAMAETARRALRRAAGAGPPPPRT